MAGTWTYVGVLPECDLHRMSGVGVPAVYDGKTTLGPWANMCEEHMQSHGTGVGVGRGQRLIKRGSDADELALLRMAVEDMAMKLDTGEDELSHLQCVDLSALTAVVKLAGFPDLAVSLTVNHGRGDDDSSDQHHDIYLVEADGWSGGGVDTGAVRLARAHVERL